MIEARSIEALKLRVDILDVISRYVEVKKAGASYVCLCPFHDDKSPSMHINVQKGFYHCFACKAGGDAFKFVMDYERISFSEAVEKIASISNFSLTYTKSNLGFKKELKTILPLLNSLYKQSLRNNHFALNYLYSRGLNDEDIVKFEIGYAPSSQASLKLLQNEKIELKDALEVGAVKMSSKNTPIASFFERITFAIYDYKDLLIGFGARSLDANNPAKYINSNQNRLFDKSKILYAYNLAKKHIEKSKEIIICEGYMDAIAFHKAGLENAVAVLGTALTKFHLPLITRLDAKVILCFDSDNAGLNAALRSATLLALNKIDGKVIFLKGGKDAAELVAAGNKKALYEALQNGFELVEFILRASLKKSDLSTALGKQKALESLQKFTFLLEPLVATSYESLVAKLLGVDKDFIKLSKNSNLNAIKSNSLKTFKPFKNNENYDLAEFELLLFLYENAPFRPLIQSLSDENFFKNKELLKAILQGFDIENEIIREFLQKSNTCQRLDKAQFLLALCRINLNFLKLHKPTNLLDARKKILLENLDKKALELKKKLNEEQLFTLLSSVLEALKHAKDENSIQILLKKLMSNEILDSFQSF